MKTSELGYIVKLVRFVISFLSILSVFSVVAFAQSPLCPADEFSLPGQDYHLVGSTGGLDLNNQNSELVGWRSSGTDIYDNIIPGNDVFIFVADNFDFAGNTDNFSFTPPEDKYEEFLFNDIGELLLASQQGFLSHGALVMNHINLLFNGAGVFDLQSDFSDLEQGVTRWKHQMSGRVFEVRAINTKGTETVTFSEKVESLIFEYASNNPTILNMSFVLVPCELLGSFTEGTDETTTQTDYFSILQTKFDGPIQTLESFYIDVRSQGNITDAFTDTVLQMMDDPLLDITPVASAGNFAQDFDFYPAALPEVRSVGSLNISSGDPSVFSNLPTSSIEVWDFGESFNLEIPRRDSSGKIMWEQTNISYSGTSYSAPTISFFEAILSGISSP